MTARRKGGGNGIGMVEKLFQFTDWLESIFGDSVMGIGFFLVAALAIMILCAKALNHYTQNVLPKRVAANVNRAKCAPAIEGKLRGFKSTHECRVLRNVELGTEKESAIADVLLIGYWGVIAFVGCDEQGELYPVDEEGAEMITYVSRKKQRVKNPMRERRLVDKGIRETLAEAKLWSTKTEAQVVFTNRRATLIAPESINGMTLEKLPKYMRAPKYDSDSGINIDITEKVFAAKVVER